MHGLPAVRPEGSWPNLMVTFRPTRSRHARAVRCLRRASPQRDGSRRQGMSALPLEQRAPIAAELHRRRADLAMRVIDEFLERHPDWKDRYGAAARIRGEEDAVSISTSSPRGSPRALLRRTRVTRGGRRRRSPRAGSSPASWPRASAISADSPPPMSPTRRPRSPPRRPRRWLLWPSWTRPGRPPRWPSGRMPRRCFGMPRSPGAETPRSGSPVKRYAAAGCSTPSAMSWRSRSWTWDSAGSAT